MRYLVQFEKSVQITEDSWRVDRPSLEVTDDKSIRDVLTWAIKQNNMRLPEKLEIRELKTL